MKKVLVGYMGLGKTSGIDKYLFSFLDRMKEDNIQVDFLSRYEDKDLKKKLEAQGSRIFKVSRNRHFIRQFIEMKKIIKENNYDVGYFNISAASNCIGVISSKLFGIKKTVVHSHSSGIEEKNPIKKCILKLINIMFKPIISICSDLNVACSDKAAKWLFSKNVYDNDDYIIMYNAVSYEKYKYNETIRKKIRKKYGIEDKFVVGHIGRFSYQKNHKFLINVFKEYKKINPESVLICVSEGPDFNEIVDYSKQLGVYDSIIFTGPIDNVEEVVQAFDCFLLPSRFEGLPVVGVEVQFSQTKCIFSDTITKMALISDDNISLPINDPKVWAENISSKKTKLNKNAEHFKLEKNYKQYDDIINKDSGKYNIFSLLLKIVLIVHYFLNLTVFYNGFNYLMVICGLLLVGIFFSNKFEYIKSKLKDYKIYLLYFLFLISYIVTFILTKNYSMTDSVKIFIWTVLHMFFVFNTSYMTNKKSLEKEIYLVFKVAVAVLSIINLNNLYLLINQISSRTISFAGKPHLVGITSWGRFYGNFYDANYASVACVIAILMGIYLINKCKSKFEKVILSLTMFLHLIYIYFGESRTGLVALGTAFGSYIILKLLLKKFNIKHFIALILSFYLFVFVFPKQSLYLYSDLTRVNTINTVNVSTPNTATNNGNGNNIITTPSAVTKKEVKIGRTDYQTDYSNGRISIWKCGYEIFKENKIIGIGFSNICGYAMDHLPDSFIAQKKFAALHNIVIDLLVSQGIIGFIIVASILLYYLINSIKVFKYLKNHIENYVHSVTLISMLIVILVSGLFVSQVFYINNYVTFAFWLILGYYNAFLISCRSEHE